MPLTTEKARMAGRLGGLKNKGKKQPATLEKERVLRDLKLRIMKNSEILFNAAKATAVGTTYLYKIRKGDTKPRIVTDPEEISAYIEKLEIEKAGGEIEMDKSVYYFMTTREPNHHAIRDLFDRAFGKPKETIEATLRAPTPLLYALCNNEGNTKAPQPDSLTKQD